MNIADQLTKVSLVLAHLPADQAVNLLEGMPSERRRAVRRRLESLSGDQLRTSAPVLREFAAAIRRVDSAQQHQPYLARTHREDVQAIESEPPREPQQDHPFSFLESLSPGEVVSVLRDELPATINCVLNELSEPFVQQILAAMDETSRSQVLRYLNGRAGPRTALTGLRDILRKRVLGFPAARAFAMDSIGVQEFLGNGGGQADRTVRPQRIDAPPPPQPAEFELLTAMTPRQIRAFLNRVNLVDLAVAYIGAAQEVQTRLLDEMLPHERALLQSHLRMLGPVSVDRTERQRQRLARLLDPR